MEMVLSADRHCGAPHAVSGAIPASVYEPLFESDRSNGVKIERERFGWLCQQNNGGEQTKRSVHRPSR
jgi:hypothetical protein